MLIAGLRREHFVLRKAAEQGKVREVGFVTGRLVRIVFLSFNTLL